MKSRSIQLKFVSGVPYVQEGLLYLCILTKQLIAKDIYVYRDSIFDTSCDL
jgi:hypothetical protein